jgi:membrane dipeptidase
LRQADCGWLSVLTVDDILKAKELDKVGLIMGWQNMTPVGGNPDRIALFHALGVRVMQPTYNEGNLIADGCLEPRNAGLTALGRQVVREANRVGVAIDLSHLGERSCLDIAEASEAPVLLTHANAKAVLDVPRNKSDEVLKAVAKTGGLIGASVYGPMCWSGDPESPPSMADFVRHLEHIVKLVGIEHVALGTDFPALTNLGQAGDIIAMSLNRYPGNVGKYAAAFGNDVRTRYLKDCGSPADLPLITEFLIKRGWSEDHVRRLLGGNYLDVLRRIWKDRRAS